MTANVNVTKVLFKRGNTVQNAAYTGINGEITVDTQAKTLRVHDGVTTGGNVIVAGGVVGSYSNTNAAAYIPTDPTITSIQANVAAANAAISAITGIDTSLLANAATQQTQINLLNANVTAANALIPNLLAVSGNILPAANVTYSLGSEQFQWRDLWVSNNTIYIGNTPIRVDNGTLLVNGAPVSGGSTYGNANVASYLLNFDGDIEFTSSTARIGNVDVITVMDSIQSPAYRFSNGVSIFDGITGTYSNTNVAAYLTTGQNVTTANLTIAGNVVQQSAYYETYANVTNSGGNLTCNFANGATFYATLNANVTVNFANVVATAGQVTGATLIVDQGATPYSVANIQINGGGVQTVKWAGGTTNTGTASNTDIMSFSLISLDGTSWRILGQIANYA